MIGNKKTNLSLLQKTFPYAILDIWDTDSTGKSSTIFVQRATIVFIDGTLLYLTEHLNKQQQIEKYFYDWVSADKKTVMAKFHSESHSDEKYQTETEPFHVHPPDHAKLNNLKRYPNFHYKDSFSIVEGIFLFHILPNSILD